MRALIFAGLVAAAAAGSTVWAGTDVNGGPVIDAPKSFNDPIGPVRDNRKQGGNTLRCWQEGRLLYEGSGFRNGLGGNPGAIAVPRQGDGESVVVLDLKQGLCILSSR